MVGFMVTLVKAGLVFGLLAITIKMLRRFEGGSGRSRRRGRGGVGSAPATRGWPRARRATRVLEVLERAPLGRTSSVVLVRVQEQHFVLGVTDQQVAMLLEVDLPDERDDAIDLRAERSGGAAHTTAALSLGELARQARQYLPGRSRIELVDVDSALAAATEQHATEQHATEQRPTDEVTS